MIKFGAVICLLVVAMTFVDVPMYQVQAADGGVSSYSDKPFPDAILQNIQEAATKWENRIRGYAKTLFWGLVLIGMVWRFGKMFQASFGELFGEFARFCVVTGFFLFLINRCGDVSADIINSFVQMGGGGIGSGSDKTAFKASEILASGLQLFMNMAHSAAKASFIDRLLLSVPAYLTLFCVTVMAANLLVLIVTATVLCYGGVFFYAFAGVEWTRDIAMNYLKSIIAVGVNIFGCLLIIHIANEIIESKISTYDPSTGQVVLTMQGLLIIVCAMIILMIISMRIPSMLAQIVSSPTGSVSPITSGMMAAATISSVGRIAGEFAVDRARDVSGGYNAMKAAVQHTGEKTVQNKDGLGTLAMQGNTVGYLTKFGMDVGKTLAGGIYENWRDKGRGVAKTIQQKTADLRKEAIEEAKMPGNRLLNSDAAKDAAIGAITGTYVSSVPADVSNYENRGEGGMISGAGATVPGLATQGGGSIGATAGAIASSAAISSGVESLPGTANMASLAGAANVNSGTVETGGGSAAVTGDFISQTAKGGEFTASEHTSGGGWDSNKANVSSDSAAGTPPPLPGAAETPPSDLDDKIHDTVDKLNNIKDTMGGS